jgi:hypothetical protein
MLAARGATTRALLAKTKDPRVECKSWTNLKALASSSGNLTVALDPQFSSDYDSEIILHGTYLRIFGNGAIVDAGHKGFMFMLVSGAELELHSITLRKGRATVSNQVIEITVVVVIVITRSWRYIFG